MREVRSPCTITQLVRRTVTERPRRPVTATPHGSAPYADLGQYIYDKQQDSAAPSGGSFSFGTGRATGTKRISSRAGPTSISPRRAARKRAQAGRTLADAGLTFDIAFTSVLTRAIRTLWIVLDEMKLMWIPVENSWRLNERHYGSLARARQSADDSQARRSAGQDLAPQLRHPAAAARGERRAASASRPRYADLTPSVLPGTESLKTTLARVQPYWEDRIAPELLRGRNVLVAAHGNSLRALVKMLEGISDDEITELNIPTGVPRRYELDARAEADSRGVPRRSGRDRGRCRGGRESGESEEVAVLYDLGAHRVQTIGDEFFVAPSAAVIGRVFLGPPRERLVRRRASRRRQRHSDRRRHERPGHGCDPRRLRRRVHGRQRRHDRPRRDGSRLHGRRLLADRHRRDDLEPRRHRQATAWSAQAH